MKIRFLGRTIEIANRVNVDAFKHEEILLGMSYRKADMKEWRNIKKFLLYCLMPYKWLNKQFMKGKL